MEREEVVTLPDGTDEPGDGLYALWKPERYDLGIMYKPGQAPASYTGKQSRWFTCREQFHARTVWKGSRTNVQYLLFRTKSPKRVIACIRHVEDKLKLRNGDRVVFRRTNKRDVLAIYLSVWWRPPVRQQTLSILLRVGRRFNIKNPNLDEITRGNKYLKVNLHAFHRFLRGYTQCRRTYFSGWVNTFQHQNRKETNLILVKPDADRERAKVCHPRNGGRRAAVSGGRKPSRVDRAKVPVKRKGN